MTNSIDKNPNRKPEKPYESFPLFPHATKRWAKKIKGRTFYFGPWDDWQTALENYNYEIPYRLQGKTPPPKNQTALTVENLVNLFLEEREQAVETGELTKRSWNDYKRICKVLVKHLGRHQDVESLTPSDFAKLRSKIAEGKTLASLHSELGRVKAVLNFAYQNDLIERQLRFGKSLARPKKTRLEKNARAGQPKYSLWKSLKLFILLQAQKCAALSYWHLMAVLGQAILAKLKNDMS